MILMKGIYGIEETKGFDKKCKCPICKTNKNEPYVNLPICTDKQGAVVDIMSIHVSCIKSKFGKDYVYEGDVLLINGE